ncbi:CheR family methyltransferase [Kaarinaea lacus]
MKNSDCTEFLQWALPQIQLRWPGYRKVRNQVCKRLSRRLRLLQLNTFSDYQLYLRQHTQEWQQLDSLCRISISRFYRDKNVFEMLYQRLLPQLVKSLYDENHNIRCWSTGCARGEEAYSLALLWHQYKQQTSSQVTLRILATDADAQQLQWAQDACYSFSSVKDLPAELRHIGFSQQQDRYCLKPHFKQQVQFQQHDIRSPLPANDFDLILCRNLVFTYFDINLQEQILQNLLSALNVSGYLIIGAHESLPVKPECLQAENNSKMIFRKISD